ncbi:MAG: hypothetical protein Fur0022_34800 [Anaerolineales bacterium]
MPNVRTALQRGLEYEIWIMLALTGVSFLSTQMLPVAAFVGIVFWGLNQWATRPERPTWADGAILILLLMLPITCWATGDLTTTQVQVYRLLNGIGLYYSLLHWANSPSRLQWMVLGLIGAGVLLALYASVSVEWAPSKIPFFPTALYERFVLLVGDTVHRNVLGGALVLIFPLPLSLGLFAPGKPSKALFTGILVAGLVILAMLILTQSRGALMAFFFAALVVCALRWKWVGWGLLGIGLAGGIFLGFYGFGNALIHLTSGGALDELPGRFETWHRAGYMIQDFPFTGIGMGTFGPVAEKLYPFILQEPGSVPHAHNLFLQVAVDLGIPGFVAWMTILISTVGVAWKIYWTGKHKQDHWLSGMGAGLFASQIALIMHGLFDAVTWGMVRPAPLVWAIWGLVVAYGRINGSSEPDPPSAV